jgi:hypothetical protein
MRAAGLRPVVKDPCKEGPGEDVGDWPAKEGGSGVGGTGTTLFLGVQCKQSYIQVVCISAVAYMYDKLNKSYKGCHAWCSCMMQYAVGIDCYDSSSGTGSAGVGRALRSRSLTLQQ